MKLYSFYNLGNTCYLNSVLQSFVVIPNFKNFLKKENEVSEYLKENIHVDLTNNNEYINHKHLPQRITRYFSKKFQLFQQHDAHEFFLEFIDTLDIKEFYGKQKMTVTCSVCQNESSTFEDFSTINLPCDKENNLVDLFVKYLDKEDIHEYQCERCNQKVLAHKNVCLYKLPEFLVIVLKSYNQSGMKIHNNVNYPDTLKIRESESGNVFDYELYSIIYHHGNSERGHYNCTVKVNNRWFFVDDDSIRLNEKVSFHGSYMLFFKKVVV